MRTDLNHLHYQLHAMRVIVRMLQLRLVFKFDPNQPRVPAGQSTGGQWTAVNGIPSGGKWNEGNRARCEEQYERDVFQCRMVLWNPACEDRAMRRLAACMKGDPIPPFFHIGAVQ
jgi:hypothetical protein